MRSHLDRLARSRTLPWIAGGALLALVAAWTLLATPRYRSGALLQVEQPRAGSGLADAVASLPGAALLGVAAGDGLETHMGVLRSRRLVDAVVDSLVLTARLEESALVRDEMVSLRIVAGSAAERRDHEGLVHAARAADGAWTLRAEELRPEVALPASVRTGEAFRIGDTEVTIVAGGNAPGSVSAFTLVLMPRYAARGALSKRLEIRRQSAGAQLITLAYEDEDPALAAAVLERLLSEHREFIARTARGDAGATALELRRQIALQQEKLSAAEEALRRFQERSGLVIPVEQGTAQIKRYATLRGELDALSVEHDALTRLLALVESKASGGRDAIAYRQLATFPSLITNRAIQDLLLALTTLENDRSELLLLRTEGNADVRRLTARIDEIERQLLRIGVQYRESLEEQIAPTRAAITAIDAEIARLPDQELRFVRLSRERLMLSEGYLLLQKQLRQTELQDALRLDQVRVVDAPAVPHRDDPYFPRPNVNLVLGLVLALAGGGTIAATQAAVRATRRAPKNGDEGD